MAELFVGRARESGRIAALLSGGGPAAVVALGDPGVGKSRLLAEVERASDLPAYRVVGYESEQLVPLAAASELLRALVSVPEHGELLDELVFRSPAHTEPVRVFEAAHRALESVGEALIVVDDLQWADDLSLALLHYLLRAAVVADTDLRLVSAGRSADRSLAFSDEAQRLLPAGRCATIELEPLDADAALELALGLAPRLDREQARRLYERSGGLPFWIETLIRSGSDAAVASSILTARLRGAPPAAGELLALLAVVARPLAPDAAAELLGWPLARVAATAEDLVARGVAAHAADGIRVAHDLLRETAGAELRPARRRDLHRRVGTWLERHAGDDVSALRQALEHRAAAGERPAELALRLVRAPQRRRLGAEGVAVLAAVADATDVATSEGIALRRGVAALASDVGAEREALERWRAFARAAPDRAGRFEAHLEGARAAFALGWEHAAEARELLAQASALATRAVDRIAVRVLDAQILLWLEHRTDDGVAAARDALDRSRRLRKSAADRRIRLDVLHTAWQAAKQEADGEEILRLGEEMLLVTRGDDSYVEALLAYADGQAKTGPLRSAEASAREALALAISRALPVQAAEAALFLAVTLHDQGRLDEALEAAATAHELTSRLGSVRPLRLIDHELALVRGGGIDSYLDAVGALRDPHVRVKPRFHAATFVSRARRAAGAEVDGLLREAAQDAAAASCPGCVDDLHRFAAAALARSGRQAEAVAELGFAERAPARDASRRYQLDYARALVAAAEDPDVGLALLEQVRSEAERLDRHLEALWVDLDRARVLEARDRRAAAELLRTSAQAAEAIGAQVPRLVAERELRRLGVRTWRRRAGEPAGAHGLTRREREVAALVAGGATNREISETLFLARTTVERHVSNVLAKVGARNRAELAALLAADTEGVQG